MKRYIVKSAACPMPNSCWGRYGRVAVIEIADGGVEPKIIRNTKTARVVATYEKLHIGSSDRDAFTLRGLNPARELAARLNAREERNAKRRAKREWRKASEMLLAMSA